MAHFAELNQENIVLRVIVVDNTNMFNENNVEDEQIGIEYITKLLGGIWKQTSYNGNFRKNFAGIGYTYDKQRDAFIPPKPFNSWILDEESCVWKAPVPYPIIDNTQVLIWDEEKQQWSLL